MRLTHLHFSLNGDTLVAFKQGHTALIKTALSLNLTSTTNILSKLPLPPPPPSCTTNMPSVHRQSKKASNARASPLLRSIYRDRRSPTRAPDSYEQPTAESERVSLHALRQMERETSTQDKGDENRADSESSRLDHLSNHSRLTDTNNNSASNCTPLQNMSL